MTVREPLGYRIKEDSDDEDIDEILTSRKNYRTSHGRFEIALHIMRSNLYT
jgi:hypothetical protein